MAKGEAPMNSGSTDSASARAPPHDKKKADANIARRSLAGISSGCVADVLTGIYTSSSALGEVTRKCVKAGRLECADDGQLAICCSNLDSGNTRELLPTRRTHKNEPAVLSGRQAGQTAQTVTRLRAGSAEV
jgi:hypothetical protein